MGQMTTQHDHNPATDPAPSDNRASLLLTLRLAEPAQGLFQTLRNRHFPADRNVVPAHVSLFHTLPGASRALIGRRLAALQAVRSPVRVEAPFPLGRGVAFRLQAPGVAALRAGLAADWSDWLTPQDRQGWRPHVTVQNKVTPEQARATLQRLSRGFVPFTTEAASLVLWRYLEGPWEQLQTVELTDPPPD